MTSSYFRTFLRISKFRPSSFFWADSMVLGDHPVLDGGVLVDAQSTHQALHAVAAEQTHQIVLEAQIEAGCTGVALTACTAAQLVVDTAALVALSTDDEQTSGSAHLFSLRFGQGLVLRIQLLEPLADSQNVGVGSLTMAVGSMSSSSTAAGRAPRAFQGSAASRRSAPCASGPLPYTQRCHPA
mgnify:CR=1 FL=1